MSQKRGGHKGSNKYDLRNDEKSRSNKNDNLNQSQNPRPGYTQDSYKSTRRDRRTFHDRNSFQESRPLDRFNTSQQPNRGNRSKERVSYYWMDVCGGLKKFTFFWRADSPFSQHHPAHFTLDGKNFNCSEQYYMYKKAVTFRDARRAEQIMATGDPARQKSIAKQIPNFEQEEWDRISYEIVKKANIAKFSQNEKLLNLLAATRGTELAEASPGDKKWGIGLAADHSDALRKETWHGENKLGRILTEIRDNEFVDVKYKMERVAHKRYYCYIGFWRSSSPFSPKHLSPFSTGSASYVSLFHYLMFKCAELNEKTRTANKIAREMRQNIIEKIAYSEEINESYWLSHVKRFLIEGNFYKFNDNPNLKALLLSTNGMVLVYQDGNYGFGSGLEECDNEDLCNYNWKRENDLGLILTFMRDEWIKNPELTLAELQSKDILSRVLDFREIDKMHMMGSKPPELSNEFENPCKKPKKEEDGEQKQNTNKKSSAKTDIKDSKNSSDVKDSKNLNSSQESRETVAKPETSADKLSSEVTMDTHNERQSAEVRNQAHAQPDGAFLPNPKEEEKAVDPPGEVQDMEADSCEEDENPKSENSAKKKKKRTGKKRNKKKKKSIA